MKQEKYLLFFSFYTKAYPRTAFLNSVIGRMKTLLDKLSLTES